ncbi:YhdH/YhfP family quinone oxidoreductase [Formosa algae]|uniref:YhdH/YhfP family quinone oxidoreductase n=1 Tax=Formosa algae TaxID=225843 RepID=A0A9X0YM01_9FLAO|nr:YhdH/YhfP family quinone oxidoreductase [Formosa algae]MBP1841485.1 putative YhdH/YhfP family quinone oxidoreductase [Formosa algae]MDQ0336593.1 putative YhdH/YhfP family quinone oxidoreductase [Formosa algae]OEI81943.1 quinone oxidoreductase [Formosa algae]
MKQVNSTFKAFRVEEADGSYNCSIKDMAFSPLEQDEIRVKVHYSSLNYKDALSASGNKGVTRNFPHTPGIDAVGIIKESTDPKWNIGDQVIVTSYDLGMNTDGGFAEYIQVPSAWAVKLPEQLSMKDAMIYGTAGLTAGMSVKRLIELVKPEDGNIVVSGATGGVGGLSISILSKLGYNVVAVTGKASEKDFLLNLGAKEILLREEIENMANKPLLKPQFAGGIDTVGGVILENIIKTTHPMGAITCCGNVASPKLELTVFPFILRGITLVGIDSQNSKMKDRTKVWEKLAHAWKPEQLEHTAHEVTLEDVNQNIQLMLKGQLKGRTIVNLKA